MLKRMTLLVKRPDLSFDEFVSHWAGPHAAIARQMPGLVSYTQNRIVQMLWNLDGGSGFQVDGIPELRFESAAAMEQAGRTDIVTKFLPEDEQRFLAGITLCVVDTGKQWGSTEAMPDGCAKVLIVGTKRPELNILEFRSGVESLAESCSKHACCIQIDWVLNCFGRPALWREPIQPDLFLTMWVPSTDAAVNVFAAGTDFDAKSPFLFCRLSALCCDPLRIV